MKIEIWLLKIILLIISIVVNKFLENHLWKKLLKICVYGYSFITIIPMKQCHHLANNIFKEFIKIFLLFSTLFLIMMTLPFFVCQFSINNSKFFTNNFWVNWNRKKLDIMLLKWLKLQWPFIVSSLKKLSKTAMFQKPIYKNNKDSN